MVQMQWSSSNTVIGSHGTDQSELIDGGPVGAILFLPKIMIAGHKKHSIEALSQATETPPDVRQFRRNIARKKQHIRLVFLL